MYFHRLRNVASLIFALALLSTVLAAVIPAPSSVNAQPPNPLPSTQAGMHQKATRALVHFPGTAPREKKKWYKASYSDKTIKNVATMEFLLPVIEYQLELGKLSEADFQIDGFPSEPNMDGDFVFDVTLHLEPPKQVWRGKGTFKFKDKFAQERRVWGTLMNVDGSVVGKVRDNMLALGYKPLLKEDVVEDGGQKILP